LITLKCIHCLIKRRLTLCPQQVATNPQAREAQKTLAYEVTKIVHGEKKARSAEKVTAVLFGGASVEELSEEESVLLAQEIPTGKIGTTLVELLVGEGVAKSNGEARRLIEGGAVSVNGEKALEDSIVARRSLVKKGKNTFIYVTE